MKTFCPQTSLNSIKSKICQLFFSKFYLQFTRNFIFLQRFTLALCFSLLFTWQIFLWQKISVFNFFPKTLNVIKTEEKIIYQTNWNFLNFCYKFSCPLEYNQGDSQKGLQPGGRGWGIADVLISVGGAKSLLLVGGAKSFLLVGGAKSLILDSDVIFWRPLIGFLFLVLRWRHISLWSRRPSKSGILRSFTHYCNSRLVF